MLYLVFLLTQLDIVERTYLHHHTNHCSFIVNQLTVNFEDVRYRPQVTRELLSYHSSLDSIPITLLATLYFHCHRSVRLIPAPIEVGDSY